MAVGKEEYKPSMRSYYQHIGAEIADLSIEKCKAYCLADLRCVALFGQDNGFYLYCSYYDEYPGEDQYQYNEYREIYNIAWTTFFKICGERGKRISHIYKNKCIIPGYALCAVKPVMYFAHNS